MSNSLLRGLRVLDVSRLLPGPFCSMYLAQLGADVIKVEEPKGGDYARTLSPELFSLVNRGKQSITLDLRKPEGAELFRMLAARADVVLESFRPGVMDRLGCGYQALKAVNPKLVFAALTGYGQTGPYRDRAGHDINYCGYAGALDQIGPAGGPPVVPNTQIADLAGGALNCAVGILAAIIGARSTGQGCFVDASMLDGTFALQVVPLATQRALGNSLPRGTDMLSGGLPNYGVYECADGRHMAIGALEPKFFLNFCAAVQRPDLAKLALAPGKAGAPLRSALTELFRSRTRDEWETLLADQDCCVSAVLSPEESRRNAQIQARQLAPDESGRPVAGPALTFPGIAPPALAPAPSLGADTAAVLASLNLPAGRLEQLRGAKVV